MNPDKLQRLQHLGWLMINAYAIYVIGRTIYHVYLADSLTFGDKWCAVILLGASIVAISTASWEKHI